MGMSEYEEYLDLFPKLNLTRLKIQAEKWANDEESIVRILF